ncbi:MAG TPA: hypothetical protein VF796_09845 [Humisphaera sp.]
MRWMLGIFAAIGLLMIGLVTAVVAGWFDPYKLLNAAGPNDRPASRPADTRPAAPGTEEGEEPERPVNTGFKGQSIFLSAADARVNGPRVRVENLGSVRPMWSSRGRAIDPKSQIPNARIQYWSGPEDSAEWTFTCPEAGSYAVAFDCVPGYSGGDRPRGVAAGQFTITAGDQTLQAKVEADTTGKYGSASVFQVNVGTINLPAGEVTMKIAPTTKQNGLLGLRSVRVNRSAE